MYKIHYKSNSNIPSEYIKGNFPIDHLQDIWFKKGLRFVVHNGYDNTLLIPYEIGDDYPLKDNFAGCLGFNQYRI